MNEKNPPVPPVICEICQKDHPTEQHPESLEVMESMSLAQKIERLSPEMKRRYEWIDDNIQLLQRLLGFVGEYSPRENRFPFDTSSDYERLKKEYYFHFPMYSHLEDGAPVRERESVIKGQLAFLKRLQEETLASSTSE